MKIHQVKPFCDYALYLTLKVIKYWISKKFHCLNWEVLKLYILPFLENEIAKRTITMVKNKGNAKCKQFLI